jgi:beta-aspartyl-peptidase (threonine type)
LLLSGAVAGVPNVANPVALARKVMEETPHCLLIADGAVKFAKKQNVPIIEDPMSLITEFSKLKSGYLDPETKKDFISMLKATMNTETLKKTKNPNAIKERLSKQLMHDTVGAVVMDRHGNIACATSTGV